MARATLEGEAQLPTSSAAHLSDGTRQLIACASVSVLDAESEDQVRSERMLRRSLSLVQPWALVRSNVQRQISTTSALRQTKTKKVDYDEDDLSNEPIPYSTSYAASWKAEYTFQ